MTAGHDTGETEGSGRVPSVEPFGWGGLSCGGLVTDQYLLTMAASYLAQGMTQPATFSLFVRRLPRERNFLVAAGVEQALELLASFSFDTSTTGWLATQGFDSRTLDAFAKLRFTGDVWAVPEGRVVFEDEPLLEVTAPLPEAQLVEALILNQVTYQTALATKAARCTLAAAGRAALIDFSLRRTHGIEAGMAASRAAAIAGFDGTSNVGAARRFELQPVGTMAHSYVTAFPSEEAAFEAFALDIPSRQTFLVDTYDTPGGVRAAIRVIERLKLDGPLAVRLDSGDLLELSVASRRLLDNAGHDEVAIVASGGLDEHEIARLLDAGAPIDVFGVGTKIGVAADAPSLDSAYKLVEFDRRPLMKLSTGKVTMPGPKQVFRAPKGSDLIATRAEHGPSDSEPLLRPMMRGGVRLSEGERVVEARDRLTHDLAWLPPHLRQLTVGGPSPTEVSPALRALTNDVRRRLTSRTGAATTPPSEPRS